MEEVVINLKSIERLNKLKDKSEVMSLLLSKSCSYVNNIKKVFQYPLILISSALVVVNSYFKDDEMKQLKVVNVTLNASSIFLLAILNNLKIAEQLENFKCKSQEFLELCHLIDASILKEEYEVENIRQLQEKYDVLTKYTLYDSIPNSVKNKVRNEYDNHHLPLILEKISPHNSINSV